MSWLMFERIGGALNRQSIVIMICNIWEIEADNDLFGSLDTGQCSCYPQHGASDTSTITEGISEGQGGDVLE